MNEQAALVTKDSNTSQDLITFDDGKVDLIKRTIAPSATQDELALFLHQCQRTGLDPLARQIYFQKYNTKDGPRVSIITGIDGYRTVADRTGKYAGSDEPVFEGKINQQRYQDSKSVPAKATVTVWKIVGHKRVPFTSCAYWQEYYPGDKMGHMWFKMPHVMLGKVAEAQALRKAFPADLSGVYTREEMDQAGGEWQELPGKDGESGNGDIVDGDSESLPEHLMDEYAHGLGADIGKPQYGGKSIHTNELEAAKKSPWRKAAKDTRAETSPDAQKVREGKRPTAEPETNGNDSLMGAVRFREWLAEQLGFNNAYHVMQTMKLLGIKQTPAEPEKRKDLHKVLKHYRHMRDVEGKSQDEVLLALDIEKGQ